MTHVTAQETGGKEKTFTAYSVFVLRDDSEWLQYQPKKIKTCGVMEAETQHFPYKERGDYISKSV